MNVSAVTLNNCLPVFNKIYAPKIKNYCTDTAFNSLTSRKNIDDKQDNILKSINEWKYFCHHQIKKGKLDIIA